MIFIFNPETDYALASAQKSYTASKGVKALRLALTPKFATILSPGDFLMLYDDKECEECKKSVWGEECISKGIKIIPPSDVAEIAETEKIEAWGWNFALRNLLLNHHVAERHLPSPEAISDIRRLAHRRTTIPFNIRLNEILKTDIPIPEEYFDAEEALERIRRDKNCFIKSPWSSSGRGVNYVGKMSLEKAEARIKGSIARQGSVMIETAADKTLDFATEWYIKDNIVKFVGLSVFRTGVDGEYHDNIIESQEILHEEIKKSAIGWDTRITRAQQEVLEELIAPFYTGPLGIDMLTDSAGRIWPCIEINLRHTMGHLALLQADRHRVKTLSTPEQNQ